MNSVTAYPLTLALQVVLLALGTACLIGALAAWRISSLPRWRAVQGSVLLAGWVLIYELARWLRL